MVAVLLVLCITGGIWLYRPAQNTSGTIAVIEVDGREYRRIALEQTQDGTFSIAQDTGKPVSFEVKDHAIRFVDVTCPDHVCEKAGWCDAPGKRAVCMPNRTTLICYAADELTKS